MPFQLTMPRFGYEMTHGTLVRWLRHEGDRVRRGEPIAEVETDKAIVELEADEDGVVTHIAVPEGETVAVGATLALSEAAEGGPAVTPDLQAPGRELRSPDASEPQGLRGGYPPRTPGADGRIPLGRMGEAIARRTSATAAEAPLFDLTVRVDMTDALALRRELNSRPETASRVSANDMIVKACAAALVKYPVYNATFEGDHLAVQPRINVGIAVALPDGLVVPAVLDCDRKTLVEIARDSRDLAQRVRRGALRPEEYTGTFTVSNLGMFQVESFTAIIVSPQVGVLAVGSVQPSPVVRSGQVVVREMMSMTLSTDHRAANGAEAAQFAAEVKRLLEDPLTLDKPVRPAEG